MRDHGELAIEVVSAVSEEGDPGPEETAASIAAAFGATVETRVDSEMGLVVVGSKPGTAAGRVTVSAAAQYLIEMLTLSRARPPARLRVALRPARLAAMVGWAAPPQPRHALRRAYGPGAESFMLQSNRFHEGRERCSGEEGR